MFPIARGTPATYNSMWLFGTYRTACRRQSHSSFLLIILSTCSGTAASLEVVKRQVMEFHYNFLDRLMSLPPDQIGGAFLKGKPAAARGSAH